MSFKTLNDPEKYVSLLLERAVRIIHSNYLGELDFDAMYYGAISGMIETLDMHSIVLRRSTTATVKPQDQQHHHTIIYSVIESDHFSVGFLRFYSFAESTAAELSDILKYFSSLTVDKVLIDLRNTPGWQVDSLVAVCNLLVKSGPLFYSKSKNNTVTEYNSSLSSPPFNDIVVLVNRLTMSAAEMLALILQEKGAFVIGQQTFGKAIAQTNYPLGDVVLKLTTAEFFSFLHGSYQGVGVIPDYAVPEKLLTDTDYLIKIALDQILTKHSGRMKWDS